VEKKISQVFKDNFAKLKDHRVNRKKLYPLVEILFVVLCGSICGAESWRDYTAFGNEKLDFLKKYFLFANGIPSKNTFARLFYILDSEAFKKCFVAWVQSLQGVINNEVIAIDGKTLCDSFDTASGASAIHMVSAFASGARLVLAQQKVENKSNEITAIPKLLDLLSLKGHTVTIDAMGCQTAIADKIITKEANYVFSLKGNQGTLNEDVRLFLETELAKNSSTAIEDTYKEVDAGHGRIETRKCIVSSQIDWLEQKQRWAGLKTIAMIEETREIGDKKSVERRFFISSLPADAKLMLSTVRAHWLIENSLHWVLDVVFNEDQSRVRKENAAQNMAIIRHIVLNMLQNAKKLFKGVGIKPLRKKAGWGNSTLELILKQNFNMSI
jgi:predicted transposase YbfD/YdcC